MAWPASADQVSSNSKHKNQIHAYNVSKIRCEFSNRRFSYTLPSSHNFLLEFCGYADRGESCYQDLFLVWVVNEFIRHCLHLFKGFRFWMPCKCFLVIGIYFFKVYVAQACAPLLSIKTFEFKKLMFLPSFHCFLFWLGFKKNTYF